MPDVDVALPKGTYLPINRCNLPARILGSLKFQQHPLPLLIDHIDILHAELFKRLDRLSDVSSRQQQFIDYLDVFFTLKDPEAAGYHHGRGRPKANWQRTLRGWFFDSESREGAVLKAWVESRFGLLPRFHRGVIRDFSGVTYLSYLEERARGLYNTNALESQLDLVYTYSQYELARSHSDLVTLYRGLNGLEQLEQFGETEQRLPVLLLNNLNSFSCDPERASEFGDRVMEIQVPRQKVFCCHQLFPGFLKGEGEYLVVGGLYQVSRYFY